MEDSFFEYRDKSAVDSESDSEFIDNSLVEDVPKSIKKKNNTVFIAESEESTDDESEVEETHHNLSKSVVRRSSVVEAHVISSSDEEASRKGSIRKQTDSDDNLVVGSSDDEDDDGSREDVSPELVPKRRPPVRPKSIDSNDSIIGRKTKKRMFLIDSDTDNSIVIEHNRHKKLTCLKDTPLKVENKLIERTKDADKSMELDNNDESNSDDESSNDDESENDDQKSENDEQKSDDNSNNSKARQSVDELASSKSAQKSGNQQVSHEYNHDSFRPSDGGKNDYDENNDDENNDDENNDDESDDDGPDEDLMVMSRATRMSIMGVVPKDDESDDSDYIQSDESSTKSKDSIANSITDLPEVTIYKTPKKPDPDRDSSKHDLTCSPFSSPLHDITSELNKSTLDNSKNHEVIDLSNVDYNPVKSKVLNKMANNTIGKENFYDDDVAIIETKEEIIALSSDDDDDYEVKIADKKSPRKSPKKSPKDEVTSKHEVRTHADIKQYLTPASYPNQVVYVKKNVRENELNKLTRLQEDLNSVRLLLEEMDLTSLPDGGSKLIERLSGLEAEVRRQGDRVANMVVEPDVPTAQDIAKDGFEKGLSWEDIQKASNAVQPRMFGKQAMATHMAERNLIIDRLRDLHESLASRPSESTLATSPRIISSELMPHQLHALAWLKWRETQRPCAGILADDMGLGKTITMISLIADDKEGKIDDDDEDDDDDDGPPVKGKLVRGGTLVVCPASLLAQWGGEVRKHCAPHALSVALHHGAARAAQPHRLAAHDLVATTYNILQRDSEKNGVLMRVRWRRVILDEAHIVRNHKSATSAAVCGLRARRRWCLTGTPVQNKDLDLFALLKFLRCSPFDELQMWKKWIDNKSQGGQERLSTIMRCILLRRTKVQLQQRGQLACLPARSAHLTEVTLQQQEMNVYQKVLVLSKSLFAQFLHQRAEKNADSTSFAAKQQDSEYYKMHKRMMALQGVKPVKSHEILVLLLRLRQVCCHCGLIAAMLDEETAAQPADTASEDLLQELDKLSLDDSRSRRKSGNKKEENDEEPQESATAAEAIRAVLSPNNPVFELKRPSSKIQAVMDCLNQNVFANKGDKAVVVSQWTSVLRLVEAELNKQGVRSVTLSGAVSVSARPALIDAVNDPRSDIKVMLLSLCAGGVGINLCGANHLLLLDPHWNPQLEEQAQDRIYRVGQKKDVHIYRFMCVGTVEQTIRKLQEAKLKIAENVLTGAKNNTASTLSIEDLKMLFNMGQPS